MEGDLVRSRGIALLFAACSASPSKIHTPHATVASELPAWELGALHVTGAPPLDKTIEDALDPFAAITASRLLDVAADGSAVLALQGGDVIEIRAGGATSARTADLDVEWAAFAPEGAILITADRDGDEDTRLYRHTTGGTAVLADGHGRIADPQASHDRLVWAEPAADGATTALWLRDRDGSVRRVFTGDGTWSPLDLSVDGTQLLARHYVSVKSSALYRIDVAHGTQVALSSLDFAAPAARFGTGVIYALSDANRDRVGLWEIRARGWRLVADLQADVTQLAVSTDVVAYVASEHGASVLHLYDPAHDRDQIVGPRGGVITDLRFAEQAPVLAFSFTDPRQPRAIYTYDTRTAQLAAWTHAELGAVDPATLVEPAPARIASFDGTPIEMLAYRPRRVHAPVVIELHGGPEDQWQPKWSAFEQFLASRGIAMILPNVRGSIGYGRAFAALDDGARRADVVRDVGAVLDWIAQQPELDREHVAVMGTSYGGYLALASLLAYPDRLRAGIDMVGITDLVGFLEGTSAYRRDQRRAEYGDERDPATRTFLAQISPLARATEIHVPLLVAQGRRDPRVPAADADRLVGRVRGAGTSVWFLDAGDEGHGFTKPDNRGAFEVLATQLLEAMASRTSPK